MKANYLIKYNIKYKTLTFIRTSVDHLYPLHNTCNNLLKVPMTQKHASLTTLLVPNG